MKKTNLSFWFSFLDYCSYEEKNANFSELINFVWVQWLLFDTLNDTVFTNRKTIFGENSIKFFSSVYRFRGPIMKANS